MLNVYNNDAEAAALPVDIVFVDEAQDLSKLQWSVVHKLAGQARQMYIVGDDDQAIYTFLGADPYGFLDHEADETTILDKSWRVPSKIGSLADKIIGRVSKRQAKDFSWKSSDGVLKYHQGSPWPMLRNAEDVMLLCRHRQQCYLLSRQMADNGIPYSLNGESVLYGPRATKVKHFLNLTKGESLPIGQAADAISLMKEQRDRLEKMRKAARASPDRMVSKDDIGINWEKPWYETAARYPRDITNNLQIRRMITKHGLAVLGRKPAIDVSTIHAAKGREAAHVVLTTDVYKSVWDEQQRSMESELRLAYVGVTRAKERLTIIRPKTNMYMRGLI